MDTTLIANECHDDAHADRAARRRAIDQLVRTTFTGTERLLVQMLWDDDPLTLRESAMVLEISESRAQAIAYGALAQVSRVMYGPGFKLPPIPPEDLAVELTAESVRQAA